MRMTFGLGAAALGGLVLTALPIGAAVAQPSAPPRGSYERQCTDIRMNGQFLSATCRGARGGGQSSINVMSCAGDIGVDVTGALSCAGPGAAAPAPPAYAPGRPGYGQGPGYNPGPGYGNRPGRYSATLYGGRNFRGPSVQIEGDAPNLSSTGLNDRVRSIQLDRRSGPWIVCADAGFRGRCTTIRDSVADTRRIGMGDAISSLRPAR